MQCHLLFNVVTFWPILMVGNNNDKHHLWNSIATKNGFDVNNKPWELLQVVLIRHRHLPEAYQAEGNLVTLDLILLNNFTVCTRSSNWIQCEIDKLFPFRGPCYHPHILLPSATSSGNKFCNVNVGNQLKEVGPFLQI